MHRFRSASIVAALSLGGCAVGDTYDTGTSSFPGYSRTVTTYSCMGTDCMPMATVFRPGGETTMVPLYGYGAPTPAPPPFGRHVGTLCIGCATPKPAWK